MSIARPCLSRVVLSALIALSSPLSAQTFTVPDRIEEPDPSVDRPGSSGPGQGELEMEREMGLAGIAIPWGEGRDVPADRATRTIDGLCVFTYRHVVVNTDRVASQGTTSRVSLGAVDGRLLHATRVPSLAAGGRAVLAGEIALPPGRSVVYVLVDASGRLSERDEKNNLRRFGVTVSGDCGAR